MYCHGVLGSGEPWQWRVKKIILLHYTLRLFIFRDSVCAGHA